MFGFRGKGEYIATVHWFGGVWEERRFFDKSAAIAWAVREAARMHKIDPNGIFSHSVWTD